MAGMTPNDISSLVGVDDVQVSPDGRHVAYVVTTIDAEANEYRSRIWVVATDGRTPPRPLTKGEDGDSLPRWSPDGGTLAFASHRDGEQSRGEVYVVPVFVGGETVKVCTCSSAPSALEWSPDGRLLGYTARNPDPERYGAPGSPPKAAKDMPPRRVTKLFARLNGAGFVVDRPTHLFVVAADGSGPPVLLTPGEFSCSSLAWAPDSSCLAFSSARHEDWDLDRAVDLWVVAADGTDVPQRLTTHGPAHESPSWSPDGARLACLVYEEPSISPSHAQLGVLDLGGGPSTARLLTASLDRNCAPYPGERPAIWDGDDLVFSLEDGGATHVYRVRADGSAPPERVVDGARAITSYDLAGPAERRILAFAATTPTALAEVFVVDPFAPDGTGERKLTSHGAAFAARVEASAPISYTAVSADGTEVPCWAVKPIGAEEGTRYPTILMIHGGPFTQYGLRFFDEFQIAAAAGYAVIYCNPRGSSGYTEAWGRAIRFPAAERLPGSGWGGLDFEDVMACAETAVKELPFVDGDRMGVMGGSYGGYMTSWIIGHSDRFVAAISERAVNNLLTEEHNADIAATFVDEIGVNHLDDPDTYLRHSPITYVRDMTTPVLIVHSEDDLRCPINQAEELFVALRLLGRKPEFVRFPGENHELSRSGSPTHRRQRAEIILEWWSRHLR